MLPSSADESVDSSRCGINENSSSSIISLPTISTTAAPPSSSLEEEMLTAVVDQLRVELAKEKRQRLALEIRYRRLAVQLYRVIDEQIRGVKAIKQLILNVQPHENDDLHRNQGMLTIVNRMKSSSLKRKPSRR